MRLYELTALGLKFRRVIDRWLFRDGGQYNCAIARMAIGLALLLTITHNGNFSFMAFRWKEWVAGQSGTGWTPKGLIKLFDLVLGGPPPEAFTLVMFWVAVVASVSMILGFATAVSQVVATAANLYIVSLQTSFGPYWSHAYNVQLLAAMAFMFSRHSGDVWSLDALLRRFRNIPPRLQPGQYWWPVIFAELATVLFMFGAFVQKFRDTGVFWALSDNIRNSLVVTWFQYRTDPPAIALWIASDPIVWKTVGMLQLVAQFTTIFAAILVARPVFRLIFGGGFFLVEILALGFVFRFWHPFWAPLCLLSVDFEHFYRRIRSLGYGGKRPVAGPLGWLFQHRLEEVSPIRQYSGAAWGAAVSGVIGFGLVFFSYYAANLAFRLGEKHLNYPFSTMGFYSVTRDQPPYAEHSYYPIETGRIDAYIGGTNEPVELWYREGALEDSLFRVNTITRVKEIHANYLTRARTGLYGLSTPGRAEPVAPVRIVYRAGLMAVPPFPQALGMVDFHMGYRAVWDERTGFRALVARTMFDEKLKKHYLTVESEGFVQPEFTALINPGGYHGGITTPVPINGYWQGDRFYVKQQFDKAFILIEVSDPVLGIKERYYGSDIF